MSLLILIFLLVVLCVGYLHLSAKFQHYSTTDARQQTNVAIAKERIKLVDDDNEDIVQALAADLQQPPQHNASTKQPGTLWLMLSILAVIPLSIALYWSIGMPSANSPQRNIAATTTSAEITEENVAAHIDQYLSENAKNIDARRLAANSYFSIGELNKAHQAYSSIAEDDRNALLPQDKINWAQTILALNSNQYTNEVKSLTEDVIAIKESDENYNPNAYLDALFISALGERESGDTSVALKRLDILVDALNTQPELKLQIQQLRNEIAASTANSSQDPAVESFDSTLANIEVKIAQQQQPYLNNAPLTTNSAVFIIARSGQTGNSGPPLAVSKHTINELPITIALNDGMSMLPQLKLSDFDEITVYARLSLTGSVIESPGDIVSKKQIIAIPMAADNPILLELSELVQP